MRKTKPKKRYIHNTILNAVGGAEVVARAFGISRSAVYQWRGVVPESRMASFCEIFSLEPDVVRDSSKKVRQPVMRYHVVPESDLQALETLAAMYLARRQPPEGEQKS